MSEREDADVLVVGSGAGGAHAAYALVERGLRVALVDFGNRDERYGPLVPEKPWSELRRTDPEQHRYFLGDDFEGVPFDEVRVGAQLTPPRLFIPRDTERLQPVASSTFSVTQSLAKGGLAAGWGAGVFPFSDEDLPGTPFTASSLGAHYERVAERIGVSGARDDLDTELGELRAMMPPLEVDSGAERVLERYEARRDELNAAGLRLGITRLAACSERFGDYGPHPCFDMDFWVDARQSVYRAGRTVDELERRETFRYLDRRFATGFREDERGVTLTCRLADGGGEETLRARALVLAAGALGSARLALASLAAYDRPIGVLCNPYTYAPVVNVGMLGRVPRDRRHSLAQLTAVFRATPDATPVLAQYYSYRSLLTFKLVKESPLATRESRELMQLLMPVMGIVGVHHPDRPTAEKRMCLRRRASGADVLEIDYRPSADEERANARVEDRLLRLFRRLGCWAIKRVRPGHGANIHYAGTLPFADEPRELTTDADGRLFGTRAVHVADGAVFPALPAKGLTFSIMANADRVGARLAEALR